MNQSNLLLEIIEKRNNKSRPKSKWNISNTNKTRYRTRDITPKQMLQRLPIALALVKAGNTSENLLNKIRQIMYYLYREKEISKKLTSNIMNLIKV